MSYKSFNPRFPYLTLHLGGDVHFFIRLTKWLGYFQSPFSCKILLLSHVKSFVSLHLIVVWFPRAFSACGSE